MTTATQLPLVALFARLESAFDAEFERRLRANGATGVSLAHVRNVLCRLEGPQRACHLAGAAGVTRQAISQQLLQLERAGLVTTEQDPNDQRSRLITLTPAGEQARDVARELIAEIEADWRQKLGGGSEFDELRDRLSALALAVGCAGERPDGCG